MQTPLKDIFLDFDDTLYDTYGNAELALRELFDHYHLSRHYDTLEDFTRPYWTANIDLWRAYSQGLIDRDTLIVERFRRPLAEGHGLVPTRELCLEMSDTFIGLCSSKPGLVDGARELLEQLQGKYRLHVCSNGLREAQHNKMRSSDTLRYFSTIVLSDDAGYNKPDRRFFEYALQVTGAKPESTLMIGDNYNTDIVGAHSVGIAAIYFNRWQQPLPTDVVPLVAEVQSLREIIGVLRAFRDLRAL